MTVHPHVCGELCPVAHVLDSTYGSSPRVWGTRDSSSPISPKIRFIPTCVGNSTEFPFGSISTAVHPHVCGELPPSAVISQTSIGSSPRVWGTPVIDSFVQGGSAVHPHVCGELFLLTNAGRCVVGSSPRVWGTPC